MPKRIPKVTAKGARAVWAGFRRYSEAVLLIMLCVVLVLAIWGWQKATNAQNRVNALELQRAAEQAAADKANKTTEVGQCFNTARTRPVLIALLRQLNQSEEDPAQRARAELLIHDYATSPVPGITGQPNRIKCIARANDLGINYARFDFNPKTGELLHPPRAR
jgi:type II secretory pathway pseudopilin PulG